MKKVAASRRQFLVKTSATAGVLAMPAIVPSSVFGQNAPSERVTLGIIGAGGKGYDGMRNFMSVDQAQIVAICDVHKGSRERAAEYASVPQNRLYEDFRELLGCKDIDAVLVASPDHWHVLQAKAAVEAGKDVYCEKPLCNTIQEGRVLVDTVHRHKAIFQHGTQLRSNQQNRHSCELALNGYLGEVRKVTIGSPPGRTTGTHAPEPVPEGLNWDLWQGPAPDQPYTPWRHMRFPEIENLAAWYFISDYSKAGWIAGYGVHDLDLAQWGLGTEHTGPVTVEGQGQFPKEGLFDTVLDYDLEFTYADGRKIHMMDTGKHKHGVKFHGTEGRWVHTRYEAEASDINLRKIRLKPDDTHLYVSRLHEKNFIECVKSREQTICPIDVAHRSTSISLIGGIALKLGRKLHWNPETERFAGDAEANALLSYPMRKPWSL